jgi:hypothetical protein
MKTLFVLGLLATSVVSTNVQAEGMTLDFECPALAESVDRFEEETNLTTDKQKSENTVEVLLDGSN